MPDCERRRLSVTLPADEHEQVLTAALDQDRSISAVVREALRANGTVKR